MTIQPFDYLNSITSNKKYLMENEDAEGDYVPFFVNRGLSQHLDCLLFANEMNINNHLDHKMQYDFLFHTIRQMRRSYGKWAKRADSELTKAISGYYGVNYHRAREYASVLTEQQKQFIIKTMEENQHE